MQVLPDGTVRLARHFSDKMEKLFGAPREPHAEITQRDMDLAYAMQHVFEEVFFHLANELHKRFRRKSRHGGRLCPQQRGQRQTVFANAIPPHLDSTGRRR